MKILVKLNMKVETWEDALRQLSALLYEKEFVKESYKKGIIEREKKFPTGLKLQGNLNVALPHADIEHVLKPALAIGMLEKPVKFRNMADPEDIVDNVKLVFIPVLTQPHEYMRFLGSLVDNVFQDPEVIKKLGQATTESQIMEILESRLTE